MIWIFIITSSCRYQHPALILTHLPKIFIIKGIHLFSEFHQSLHIFLGDFLVKSSWSFGCWFPSSWLHISWSLPSSHLPFLGVSIKVSLILVNQLIGHIMLISSRETYAFLHPFRGWDPFSFDHAWSMLPATIWHDITILNTILHTSFLPLDYLGFFQ